MMRKSSRNIKKANINKSEHTPTGLTPSPSPRGEGLGVRLFLWRGA